APMASPLRAPLSKLALVLAAGGLAACQAASGSTPARRVAPTPPVEMAPVAQAPQAPQALQQPTLGPLGQRLGADLLVHGSGVDAGAVQKVAALVPPNRSATMRQGQIVLALDDGPRPLPAAGVDPA